MRIKDRLLWDKITTDSTHPLHELLIHPRDQKALEKGVQHPYILSCVRTEGHKRCFVNSFQFYLIVIHTFVNSLYLVFFYRSYR